ncbi:VPA1269 family protein [Rhizobium ruizarguesonis]
MITEFPTDKGIIAFNGTMEHWFGYTNRESEAKDAIDRLQSISATAFITIEQFSAEIDLLIEEEVCLSPSYFISKGMPNYRIAERIVQETEFGDSILTALTEVGLMGFAERLEDQETRDYVARILLRLIASLVMASTGLADLDEAPKDLILSWLAFWRTADGLRWRTDLVGKNGRMHQCLKEIAQAFARYYEDDSLLRHASQSRLANGNKPTWAAIQGCPTPLQADLLSHYSKYAAASRARPTLNKNMLMDLDVFLAEAGHSSLFEALQIRRERREVAENYMKRFGATRKCLDKIRQLHQFQNYVIAELRESSDGITLDPLVTEDDINWIKGQIDDLGNRKHPRARSRPLPERLYYIAKQILDEGENGWAGRVSFFKKKAFVSGQWMEVYCPVIPTLLRCAFDLPLRMAQWRRLDSGEGDLRRFNARTMVWETNPSENAGFWATRDNLSTVPSRGYALLYEEVSPAITGFFVNTNKTGSPYGIPWMAEDLHLRLFELLEWQLKFNSVKSPVGPDDYLDDPKEYSARAKARLPDIFALFRTLPDGWQPYSGRPPTAADINLSWNFLMMEVERVWNEVNPDDQVTIIVKYNEKTGQPQKSIYTPHGMRVRGITNLYRAGIPIDILSEMVAGHASIIMTLYYVLYDASTIHNILEKAAVETQSIAVREFMNDFRNMKIEEARLKTTFTEHTSLEEAVATADRVQFCNSDIGVCPFDGTRCNDGGPLLRKENVKGATSKNVYGAVPGGPRNCIMCRHLISGPPFIIPLELFGSSLLAKRKRLAVQQADQRRKLNTLRERRRTGDLSNEVYRQTIDRLRIENNEVKDHIENVDEAIYRTVIHLTSAAKILAADRGIQQRPDQSLMNPNGSAVVFKEVSDFEQAAVLTAASRVYSILHSDELEALKQKTLDQILFKSGILPLSLRADITDEERVVCGDLFSKFLLERFRSDEITALRDGKLSLRDLDIADQVEGILAKSIIHQPPNAIFENSRNLVLS